MVVWVTLMVGGLAFNAMIGVVLALFLVYLSYSRAYLTHSRIVLGRCVILTLTT